MNFSNGWYIVNNPSDTYKGKYTWEFSHEDYDPECDQRSLLCGNETSEQNCIDAIDCIESTHDYFNEG